MPVLLLPPPRVLPWQILEAAAKARGWQIEKPLIALPPERFIGRDDLVLYGDWRVVTSWANSLNQALLGPSLSWLPNLPEKYRRRAISLMPFGEAIKSTDPLFLKPAGLKAFAKVFPSGASVPDSAVMSPDTPMLVAEPVKFDLEVRCFVLDRRIATYSAYYRQGRPITHNPADLATDREMEAALEFAESVLQDDKLAMPPGFVMDVGLIPGRGWAIVEAGPAWFSHKYSCDAGGVLNTLRRVCVPMARLQEEDQPWVVRFSLGASG